MFFGVRSAWCAQLSYSVLPADGGAAPAPDVSASNNEGRAESRQPTAGVLDELSGVIDSARAALSNILDLLSLETRRAGLALLWMVVLGLAAAICIVSAWLGLMTVLVMWAVSLGFPPIAAVLTVAVINLAAGAALIYVCIDISRDLLFSATRRQVAGQFPVMPPAP